jgi:hypothetical protein
VKALVDSALAREWLPLSAATHDAMRGRIGGVVDQWSARWFAGHGVSLGEVTLCSPGRKERQSDSATATGMADWQGFGHDIAVRTLPSARAQLAGLALNAQTHELAQSAADRDLMEALGAAIVADLVRALGAAFGVPVVADGAEDKPAASPRLATTAADPLGEGGLTISLEAGREAPVTLIALSWRAILPVCKSTFAKPGAARRPSVPRATTAARTPVVLEASLGRASIALADLRSLAPGDVLILDTTVNDGAAVSVADSEHVFARARIIEAEGCVGLIFQTGPS